MAHSNDNIVMKNTQGAIGKQIVFKKINGKTVAAKYPDMSQVEYTKNQTKYRTIFAKAVEYAREILNNPEKRKSYEKKIRDAKGKKGTSVYHVAVKEFMDQHSEKVNKRVAKDSLNQYMQNFKLTDRQAAAVKYLLEQGRITNSIYQRINDISRITATRDLRLLVQGGIIVSLGTKGAGAYYKLKG